MPSIAKRIASYFAREIAFSKFKLMIALAATSAAVIDMTVALDFRAGKFQYDSNADSLDAFVILLVFILLLVAADLYHAMWRVRKADRLLDRVQKILSHPDLDEKYKLLLLDKVLPNGLNPTEQPEGEAATSDDADSKGK